MDNEVTNSEYEVIKRRLVLSRKLKDLAETGKDSARLSDLISNADIELAAAEDACRFGRFNIAAQCMDRAEEAFARIEEEIANTFLVIDLSNGPWADSYPVSYLAKPPFGGFNTCEYKTDKIVLRRITPGTFKFLGKYKTILTKPYYIGIFEVTQRQWGLVMGRNPARKKGEMYPVESVFYDTIRGGNLGADWPKSSAVDNDSFIGRLRKRTQLDGLDLPTEAQWEYACRAGATNDYSSQEQEDAIMKHRPFENGNGGNGHEDKSRMVGSCQPNDWGLYDMHITNESIIEWCLDWHVNDNEFDSSSLPFVNPNGPQRQSMFRVLRGGMLGCPPQLSWSEYSRWSSEPNHNSEVYGNAYDGSDTFGFRLAMHSN